MNSTSPNYSAIAIKFGFGKKSFGSDTDTEIGPWFRFPISKPGFGRTLVHADAFFTMSKS